MAGDGMALTCDQFQSFRLHDRHAADGEESRLGAEAVERIEDGFGRRREGPVVEGEYNLAGGEETRPLVLKLKAKARTSGRIDDLDPRNAQPLASTAVAVERPAPARHLPQP